MRKVVVTAVSAAALLVPASPALAFHCYVADKPDHAGAFTEDEVFFTGKDGDKIHAPGAFIDLPAEAGLPDIFVRGDLTQAHANGPDDHGIVALPDEG